MRKLIIYLFVLFLGSQVALAQAAGDVLGEWLTDQGKARIEIYKENGKYNGKIVWLKEPNNPDGSPKLDVENPDDDLQKRPIMGLNLIEGFTFDDDEWVDGEIYDPESGKTYDCKMELNGNELEVRGYIGISMFGRTVTWTRVK